MLSELKIQYKDFAAWSLQNLKEATYGELLLKENLIQVAGTSMNGKVYARNYTPLLSREDYLKGNAKSRKINPVEMMNALLESDGITVEELEKLQELIDKKRAELESR